MRYLALATDYDGTLAVDGAVDAETLAALARVRESGRRLVLVTGRELPDLMQVFPEYALFDRIVAENGALVFAPETREERLLAEPPPEALVELLRAHGVTPLSTGRAIVATRSPHETAVLDAIKQLGLELQLIFNKGAVMVLPTGVNKATGLRVALQELSLSPHNVVAIGDAENDHALLSECELAVAVDNALPVLRERADFVTAGARSAGVRELIARLLRSDLRELSTRLTRHNLPLGTRRDGSPLEIHPYGRRVLVCGTSGSGKSTLVSAFLERLNECQYQFCLVDPEGDFAALDDVLALGTQEQAAMPEHVLAAIRSGNASVSANLLGIQLDRRSEFFVALMARCGELRAHTGRPHFIVVDEAHHMLPAGEVTLPAPIEHLPSSMLFITVHPERLAGGVLRQINALVVLGSDRCETVRGFARALGRRAPKLPSESSLEQDEALFWACDDTLPLSFRPAQPRGEHRRHQRKYASGALGEDKSFYFRGAHDQLKLRAHNLSLFLQMGDGVDDDTWLHHLRQHDYSRWIRDAIKNDSLASEIEHIEREETQSSQLSRRRIRQAIEKVYTMPA